MRLLLLAYPRRWRDRYADELVAMLEAEPLTWRARANVLTSGLRERMRASGPAHARLLWAWSLFVVGGMGFQKASEHWQSVVPRDDRTLPTLAFDTVEGAAAVGSVAVLLGVALALPSFFRDLRDGGWTACRGPILVATSVTGIAAAALVALAIEDDVAAASVFVAAAVLSLFAWTRAATVAAQRVDRSAAHRHLARTVTVAMVVVTVAAASWFASVTALAPSFVGAAQLAVVGAFMLGGVTLAVGDAVSARDA